MEQIGYQFFFSCYSPLSWAVVKWGGDGNRVRLLGAITSAFCKL